MTTTPQILRPQVPTVASEREMLEAWLEYHRATLLIKCAGLTDDQLRLRSVEPSSLSLLGIIRHMSEVELGWFVRGVVIDPVPLIYCTETEPEADFEAIATADVEADFATYAATVQRARTAIAPRSLDDEILGSNQAFSVRWIYLHMIEEYARHNGHADLLRERIDGMTGD